MERWRSALVLVLSAVLFLGVVLIGPGSEMAELRRILGLGKDPLGEPADVVPGGVHAFLEHQPGQADEPVTWDPCREIRYQINPDQAPDGTEETVAFVQESVDEVSAITGLRFAYEGLTDRRPEHGGQGLVTARPDPVLVAWATADEVEELEGAVAGVGGATARSYGDDRWLWFVTGGVTLDADALERIAQERDGGGQARAILLHELGHLVGLDHVDSDAELMFADNVGQLDFGQGDLNGLALLGTGKCR
ncbi:hypothetical protein KVF89_29550 [Nocardioides carbamazepini]|uniref:matrixin family metalloprotease n=1 Tax=Nocardioides carbamazepini TaxID=2854259 RepID=UPI0021499A76|nr:matrixin family metalloprotease [Nocardioides carbamazepini]MCR1786718.1 hypothetical protein [Nocardioides carbamazepini]